MRVPEIETDTLALRFAGDADAAFMLGVCQELDASLLAAHLRGPVTKDYVRQILDDYKADDALSVLIVEAPPGKPAGWVSVGCHRPGTGDLFIDAIVLDPAVRRAGRGGEIIRTLLAWAADVPELRACIAAVSKVNTHAIRFWEALDFFPLEEKAGVVTLVYQLGDEE